MFSSGSAQHALGRPQDRLAAASPVRAAGCRGLHVRRAWRSLFFVFTLLLACRPSGQPSFSACFSAFLDVCVCVCVCENCHLGAFVFPRASLFSAFLRTLALSARALLFVIAIFWLAVHFHVLLRVGPACAGSAPRSPRCSFSRACRGLQGAACPPSLAELIFCLHSVACLSSIGPTILFRMFFRFSRRVCVCVCM